MKLQSAPISFVSLVASLLISASAIAEQPLVLKVTAELQPADRNVRIRYVVPDSIPDQVIAKCAYRLKGQNDWQQAAAMKLRSRTALTVMHDDPVLSNELSTGEMNESLPAGQTRTAIWQTFPQLANGTKHELTVRIEIYNDQRVLLASGQADVVVDLSDVVLLDQSMIYRRQPVYDKPGDKPGWVWRKDVAGLPNGALDVVEGPRPLEPLAFRPNLRGSYAIYVAIPDDPPSEVELRLSGDYFSQRFPSLKGREYFWRVARMDGQNIVASQAWRTISTPAEINNDFRSRWKYVRLVPISPDWQKQLAGADSGKRDKLVFGLFEPYSWCFTEYVDRNDGWLDPIAAFAEAKVDAIDIQYARIGAKPYYESLVEQPLLNDTAGDPAPGGEQPISSDVGRLALFCQGVPAAVRAGKAFGVDVIANMGAGNAYPGNALQSEFAKAHPEWIKNQSWPQHKYKEVRAYALSLYREMLEAGARRISIDFCRYQHTIDDPKTPTLLLTEMRKLADEYSKPGDRVKISVRFPIPGSGGENGNFKPQDWIKAGLVDYIVPSSVFGNALYFDVAPYVKMTRGTSVKCLPCVEAGVSGAIWPGQLFQQTAKFYDDGADGIFDPHQCLFIPNPERPRSFTTLHLRSFEHNRRWAKCSFGPVIRRRCSLESARYTTRVV